jgi:hypothetical protein
MPSVRITPVDPPYPAEVQAEFDKIMRGAILACCSGSWRAACLIEEAFH